MRQKRNFILLSAALALCLLAGCGEAQKQSPAAAQGELPVQAVLTEFTAATLDGGSFTPDELAARDVTIFNFWTTRCGPCVAEMPELAAYAAALPDNVALVTVCLDAGSYAEDAQTILEEAGFAGTTLVSGDGDFPQLCAAVQYTPTTIFVDSEGNMVGGAIIGRQEDTAATLTAAVNQVLEAGGKDAITLADA